MHLLACFLSLAFIGAAPRTVPPGSWGGPHARLTVRASGALIEFDCARGSISGRIPLDADGVFAVRGRYTPERGGPVRKGDTASGVAVTYRGTLRNGTLTLEPIAEDGAVLGTFELSRGVPARLMKCR